MATFARGHWQHKTDTRNAAVRRSISRESSQTTNGKVTYTFDPSNAIILRGIPAIGPNVAGAIRGTNPGNIRFD
jgi:hypothetical protein